MSDLGIIALGVRHRGTYLITIAFSQTMPLRRFTKTAIPSRGSLSWTPLPRTSRLGAFATGARRSPGAIGAHHVALALSWRVRFGRDDAQSRQTPLEKTRQQSGPAHWSLYRSVVSWFIRGLRRLKRCLQNDLPLPAFHTCQYFSYPSVTDG